MLLNEAKRILKKNGLTVKKLKYTDLAKYRKDLYNAILHIGGSRRLALETLEEVNYEFMMKNQDIYVVANEAKMYMEQLDDDEDY